MVTIASALLDAPTLAILSTDFVARVHTFLADFVAAVRDKVPTLLSWETCAPLRPYLPSIAILRYLGRLLIQAGQRLPGAHHPRGSRHRTTRQPRPCPLELASSLGKRVATTCADDQATLRRRSHEEEADARMPLQSENEVRELVAQRLVDWRDDEHRCSCEQQAGARE